MTITRELIAAAVLVVGFALHAFCQVQDFGAAFYQQAVREATEAYRGDVDHVVLTSSGYDYIPMFRIPTEFQEELNPVSAVPFTLRITFRLISNHAWPEAADLSD
jgi:hypothetical protein